MCANNLPTLEGCFQSLILMPNDGISDYYAQDKLLMRDRLLIMEIENR